MKLWTIIGLVGLTVEAVQLVPESSHSSCTPFEFQRELRIYKDPSFFVPDLALMYDNKKLGWEELMEKSPVLTTIKGSAHLQILGNKREFRNFGEVAKLYEIVDPRFRSDKKSKKNELIVPIKICGQNEPYADSLGFVLDSDLTLAQTEEYIEGARLPPSTVGRPIPKLPKNLRE